MSTQAIFFIITFGVAIYFFVRKIQEIIQNIQLGQPEPRSDQPLTRLKVMLKVAFGQTKMTKRPIAALLHGMVYVGFVIINLEVLEIVIDGILGTHRIFAFIGSTYAFLISCFEVLAVLVVISCVIFLIRRYMLHIKRFQMPELTTSSKRDATIILYIEILLMFAFLIMNTAEGALLQNIAQMGSNIDSTLLKYQTGLLPQDFWVTQHLQFLFSGISVSHLIFIERIAWWAHIIGILSFLNYLPYSKHFHIILAFPSTYFSNLNPKGQFKNIDSITNEVKSILDPSFTPEANAPAITRFGAKDVQDLSWKSLLDAYTCTECGRCSSVCPAKETGKLLSPRKILMDTRDRLEEVGKNRIQKKEDQKSLLDDYIKREELLACTSCNACTEACPINLDPLSIILQMRQYLIMEESQAPTEWQGMFNNIENAGSPWAFSPEDRVKWREE